MSTALRFSSGTSTDKMDEIGALLAIGDRPLAPNTNTPMAVSEPYGPGGGYLLNNLPINYYLDGTLLPIEVDALKALNLWSASYEQIPLASAVSLPLVAIGGFLVYKWWKNKKR